MTSTSDGPSRGLDHLLGGFDGRPLTPRDGADVTLLWRVGRWLRTQGARRPASLRVAGGGAMIIDGRILTIDDFGSIQDLSTTRRVVRTPLANWKHL